MKKSQRELYDEIRGRLIVNKDNLDDELIHQPELYFRAAAEKARASSRLDAAKDQVKTMSASLFIQLEEEMGKKGKTTVSGVQQAVESHERMQTAKLMARNAAEEYEEWQALVEAISQRSYILRELAQLYIANYYTSSSVSDQTTAEAKARIAEKRREKAARA